MEIRALQPEDLERVCRHREQMFREAGSAEEGLHTMTAHFRRWLQPRLADGSYFGYLLLEDGQAVAGIGLMLIDWPPHPAHPDTDKRGYVLNVYVEPACRKRGLASQLMQLAEADLAQRGARFAILHATDAGRSLYASLGWKGTTEMAKAIDA
jgi:ribosomal protein S18 acetylase RimI-like enzyme